MKNTDRKHLRVVQPGEKKERKPLLAREIDIKIPTLALTKEDKAPKGCIGKAAALISGAVAWVMTMFFVVEIEEDEREED